MSIEIAIHGGGYCGLTAAVHYAKAGKVVMVYDPDPSVVEGINAGKPKAGEFLGYLGVSKFPDRDYLRATTSFEIVQHAPAHVICVPTEQDGQPCMEAVECVLNRIYGAWWSRTGTGPLIVIESTLTPGTIDGWCKNLDKKFGENFFLAHAPRRDWFADPNKNLGNLPRVVGGVTPRCTSRAVELISSVTPVDLIMATDHRTAELTKPLENAFFHAQVALANEVACLYPNVDVARAVELACTHWRLSKVHLSAGTGGRCIPLGPRYLLKGADIIHSGVVSSAISSDGHMPRNVAEAVRSRLVPPADVLVLGIAYRPGFRDAGSSPGLAVAHELWRMGYRVSVVDPMWSRDELSKIARLPAFYHDDLSARYAEFDAVVLATPHAAFRKYVEQTFFAHGKGRLKFFLDAQGAWQDLRPRFAEFGVEYKRVGDPGWR